MIETKKSFVLDTNILLIDFQAMFKFEENTVIIPMIVLEELDRFKKEMDERGFNARETARYLDKLSKRGVLSEGVELNNGGTLIVSETNINQTKRIQNLDLTINDNLILQHAFYTDSIVVSKDINVRLKARAAGLVAQDYQPSEVRNMDEKYLGHSELDLSDERFEALAKKKWMVIADSEKFFPNEYILVKNEITGGSLLCKYDLDQNSLRVLNKFEKDGDKVLGLKPKNAEQRFAIDALLDPKIQLVTLMGKAGTGKTLLAVACGLSEVIDPKDGNELYRKLYVARPIQPMGKDLGYLPGDMQEKLAPWMQPIMDNIEYLFEENRTSGKAATKKPAYSIEQLIEQKLFEVGALTYIRGRSIPFTYIIIDEAQNLSPSEMKTILTRAGEGTKIVLTGDINQIDSPYLDQINNGLSYVIDKFKGEKIAVHITLTKGERSALAEIASNIL